MVALAPSGDDRAVSERLGVLTLILVTVVVTITLGIGVLLATPGAESTVNANFSFDHTPESQTLLVTYRDGEALTAGSIHLSGDGGNFTWAAAANIDAEATVQPGDTITLGESGVYSGGVEETATVVISYNPSDGQSTIVDGWNRDPG